MKTVRIIIATFEIIVILLLGEIECGGDGSTKTSQLSFQVAFISPANAEQEIELNYRIENLISGFRVQNGWRVEAHTEHTFNFYLIANSPTVSENISKASTTVVRKVRQQQEWSPPSLMQFYIFFTLNPNSCDDFLDHTHIPILIERFQQTRRGLFKAHVSFTLGHSDQPYFICLSDLFDLSHERTKRAAINETSSSNYTYDNNNNKTMSSSPRSHIIHEQFHHQGSRVEVSILTYDRGLSLPTKVLIYVCLILLNSIFNGLNIGLMSLSISELELMIKTSDSSKERKYARNILPLRRHGNFLLCSILLSITLTSSVSVLLLDDLIQGFFAGVISTVVLCIFGEISPQAICSRYALFIGSHTRKLTYLFMGLTCVCSWPLSKIVDWALGKELPIEYSRDALKYLIRKSIDLKDKQCEIITGALEFKDRHIKDIMMPLDRVFMISSNEKLDFETMAAIYSSGFSRIPVFDNVRNNIIGWFHVKDLSLIDSNDKLSVRTLVQLCRHKVAFCYTTDTLSAIFELFRHGSTHLAFVLELVQNADIDPYESCVGIVTMHDIIEALLQFEIIDEAVIDRTLGVVKESATAALGINYLKKLIDSHKQRRHNGNGNYNTNNSKSCESFGSLVPMISLQTKFILSQILNNLKPFQEEFLDKSILEKIIMNEQNYFHRYKNNIDKSDENGLYIYRYNQPSDYFVLLLSGSYLIEAGTDKIELLAKQYDHYGERALLGDCTTIAQVVESSGKTNPYVPEFSLKLDRHQASEAPYTFLLISRDVWLSAVKSTYFRRMQTT